jgi:hypothetical protein
MALVKHNNNSISNLTSVNLPQGKMTLISSQTASGSASVEFTSGIDSTYPVYKIEFINPNPNSGAGTCTFQFNGSSDGGSNYNVVKTTTNIQSTHGENDAFALLRYNTSFDIAQGTGFQSLCHGDSNTDADASLSGELFLFNPSSTTYVKHFIARVISYSASGPDNVYTAGYFNTTSVINAIKFQFSAGVIESGTIKLYGIGD